MASISDVFDQKEYKDRRRWLFASICFFVLYPIFLVAFVAVLSERGPISEGVLYRPLGYAIAGLILLWIIWHCAYRKHGTALLTLWLVVGPFRLLASTIKLLGESCDVWTIGIAVLDVAVYAWWYALSLKLRKINKIFQMVKQGCPEEFIQMLKNAPTVEDLDNKFSELIKKWPRFEPILSKEYKSKNMSYWKKHRINIRP